MEVFISLGIVLGMVLSVVNPYNKFEIPIFTRSDVKKGHIIFLKRGSGDHDHTPVLGVIHVHCVALAKLVKNGAKFNRFKGYGAQIGRKSLFT